MRVSPEDLAKVLTPELRHLMAISPNAGYSVASDYAFQCVACRDIGMDSHYNLLKETVGPLGRTSEFSKLKSARGIVRLDELSFKPEYDSHLNFSRKGLVCDHCKDSGL